MVRRRIAVQDRRGTPHFVPLDPTYLSGNAARLGPAAIGVLVMLSILVSGPPLDAGGRTRTQTEAILARTLGTDIKTVAAATARLEHWGFIGPDLVISARAFANC